MTIRPKTPCVAIVGGGPGGLLLSLLLSKRNIPTVVFEKASCPDEWSTKSYSIVLGERGTKALESVGILDTVSSVAMKREFVSFFDGETGNIKKIPKSGANDIGLSRPLLIDCLEVEVMKDSRVELQKDSEIVGVQLLNDGWMQLHLKDKPPVSVSHLVGADGKWSKVRQAFPELDSQFVIKQEPSFGLHVMAPTVPETIPTDGTVVVKTANCPYYIIAAPLPTGELSISIICNDKTIEAYPWLKPSIDEKKQGWENEYSALPPGEQNSNSFRENLKDMLQEQTPAFFAAIDTDALASARTNRRVAWLQPRDSRKVSYGAANGRVALIGDAAHAITPSMGLGCNLALESALKLSESITSVDSSIPTEDDLCSGFRDYSTSRPKEVVVLQEQSAQRSRA